MCSANGRVEISNERHPQGLAIPNPPLCLAWCHLSSLSLQKGCYYCVSIWKRLLGLGAWPLPRSFPGMRLCWAPQTWVPTGELVPVWGAGTYRHVLGTELQPATPQPPTHPFRAAGGHSCPLPGLLAQAAIGQADKGGFPFPLSLQALQMPYIPGAGRDGGSCGF